MTPTVGLPPAALGPETEIKVQAGRARDRTQDRRDAARASQGDVAAFSRLVGSHAGLVHGVALRVLGASDAPDASQEAWIRVWRNIKDFRAESAFTTWLYRIAINSCLDLRRARLRRGEWERDEDETVFLA